MDFFFEGGFGVMFTAVSVFIAVVFVFIIVTIIIRLSRSAKQHKKDNDSPVLTVDAKVVTKRSDVYQYNHYNNNNLSNNMHHMGSSTTYYTTFEVSSGDRMEFKVQDTEYGMLVENDTGKLTFQGSRYLGFERG